MELTPQKRNCPTGWTKCRIVNPSSLFCDTVSHFVQLTEHFLVVRFSSYRTHNSSRGAGHRGRHISLHPCNAAGLASVTAAGRLSFVRKPDKALRLSVTLCACDQLRRCRVRASAPALDPAPTVRAAVGSCRAGSSFRQDPRKDSTETRCGCSPCQLRPV